MLLCENQAILKNNYNVNTVPAQISVIGGKYSFYGSDQREPPKGLGRISELEHTFARK